MSIGGQPTRGRRAVRTVRIGRTARSSAVALTRLVTLRNVTDCLEGDHSRSPGVVLERWGWLVASDYARALGSRLRAIRTQQGLSLHGVEEKSQGRWKAVVVGSYERGDRAVTVQRLAELADFYGVPVQELLPGGSPNAAAELPPKLMLNLEVLQNLGEDK